MSLKSLSNSIKIIVSVMLAAFSFFTFDELSDENKIIPPYDLSTVQKE